MINSNYKTIAKLSALLLATGLILSSCKVVKPYQLAQVAPNNLFRDTLSRDSVTMATLPWKEVFTDSKLQGLIEEGIKNNLDLQIAASRLDQARANVRQSNLSFFPTANLNVSTTVPSLPAPGSINNTYDVSLGSSWEIDFWGKLRSTTRASLMALKQSEAYSRAVQTQLIADIASYYYTLLAYDAQLKITQHTVEISKEEVESMKVLKESNIVTGAAVVQSEANRYSAEVTIPTLKQHIRETENSICLLLGRAPGSIEKTTLDSQKIAVELKTGLPSQLLANRPDVQESEYQLRYYAELTNVARTYFYPAFTITAQGGFSNNSLSQLVSSASFFSNLVGGLTQPILNRGLNKQRLQVAKARQEEYFSVFRQTFLNAGREVSDALYECQVATDKIGLRSSQIIYLEKSVEYTKELLKYSSATNYTDVLLSEQSLLAAQLNSVNDKQQQLMAIIKLYRSLGGGTR